MKIKTRCEHCGKVYQMDDNFLGQIAQCRNCRKYFTMTLFEDQSGPLRAPGQPPANTQAAVCPQCNFTAAIPRVSRKLKLRCQRCGRRFAVKPESQPGQPPTGQASGYWPVALALWLIILGVLVAGPKFFPKLFRGLPDLLGLLPF
jgi:uncharacterized paraquat-inducible protein A